MSNKKVIHVLNYSLLPLILVVFFNGLIFPSQTADIMGTLYGDVNANITLSFYYIGKVSFVLLVETIALSGLFYLVSQKFFYDNGE